MVGRPPKPQVSLERESVLKQLQSDLAGYHSSTKREAKEQRTGRKMTAAERKADEAK